LLGWRILQKIESMGIIGGEKFMRKLKMKWNSGIFAFFLVTVFAISVLSSYGFIAQAAPANKKLVIGYATKSSSSPFFVVLNQGAKKAAQDLGVDLVLLGPPKEQDIAGQIAVIEDMINKKVDALIITPVDSVGVTPVVQKANKAKIPVIAVNTAIIGGKVESFIATDNYKAAELAAQWMAKRLDGKGNLVVIQGMIASETGKDRWEGFKNCIEKNYPAMKIVAAIPGDWVDEKALQGMEDAIRANPQIDGVFSAWDGGALAAHRALTEANRKNKTVICGFDCYPQSLKLMKQGTFEADIAQYAFKQGYEGVKAAVMVARGQKVAKRIDTGTMVVSPENVDQFIKDTNVKLP
jgi:ribose transport system substrate-binding protein